ncbi:uncharacterized protein LOC124450596 isoform X2 [Xenia sp. Carnegie-2017]|nr:uncharacterized protein LOC124450596 isoform X2 [Xenia sp. Carnegie-2017]XP_046857186.1 uncharacterized protein LOC124450596 isoform X2 [Xenia sp. Carnegie-2017]XP_046857187.1 uncharacterized protein LOC124450596 isoform X2 [Xenia sp. Carnegie-2017]XP_046857188.1 uncharacterized protein LOC124450596 isoform X2 [Xenia sp. Carnegie-2017]XP_046857189.1 uncharacterized protein LOC124450596 isoform X2 [Xenia sp. Carnegie-2017]XP_046857190.1 uncharacterized protein LOC124450596 isoform X2 [Xenia 
MASALRKAEEETNWIKLMGLIVDCGGEALRITLRKQLSGDEVDGSIAFLDSRYIIRESSVPYGQKQAVDMCVKIWQKDNGIILVDFNNKYLHDFY